MRRFKLTWVEKKEYSTEFDIDDEMSPEAQEDAYHKQIEHILATCASEPDCEADPEADPIVDHEVEEIAP